MEQNNNRVPALTLLALAAVFGAFTIPSYAPLFWILAGILSFSAAMLAYRTRPEFSEPRTAFLSLVFTVVGVVIGIILLQLL
jgi:hypothetical protein